MALRFLLTCFFFMFMTELFAKEIYLNCPSTVSGIYSPSKSVKIGDKKVWKFNVNLDRGTGQIIDYQQVFSTKPSHSHHKLNISPEKVTFGRIVAPMSFTIDRISLELTGQIKTNEHITYVGTCSLIPMRVKEKRKF